MALSLRHQGVRLRQPSTPFSAPVAQSRAVELSPESEESFRNLIVFYLTAKQPDRAMQKLNSNPDDHKQAFHYELMGVVAAELGKRQEAENA